MQRGRNDAPNVDELNIKVQLATFQARVSAPLGTEFNVQLPYGRLTTSTFESERKDSDIGDLEIRLRQNLPRLGRFGIQLTLGAVLPTGPYVPKAGAANLAPEASFLTLGRGVTWWIAEAQVTTPVTKKLSSFTQVSARGPLEQANDEFDWGKEARWVLGAQLKLPYRLSGLLMGEWQWREQATEPDPFEPPGSDVRLDSSNTGGHWWTLTPALTFRALPEVDLLAGVRVPIVSDVKGNQLVPSTGFFVGVSGTFGLKRAKVASSGSARSSADLDIEPGRITVVDYWATWCAPCKQIDNSLKFAEATWGDEVKVIRVDASEWPGGDVTLPEEATGLPVVVVYGRGGQREHLLLGEDALGVVDAVNKIRTKGP